MDALWDFRKQHSADFRPAGPWLWHGTEDDVGHWKLAAALAALSIAPAAAQGVETDGEAARKRIENVVVTASFLPLESYKSGSAISIIDGAELARRQIRTAFDALREVPGVAVSRTGTLGSLSQVRLRGAEANQVLVLIDGVEANDPAASSEFNFAHLLTADIARIEVLRGPQSALWGADALAGVINVITRRPETGVRVSAGAGSFGTTEAQASAGYATEGWGAGIYGAWLDSDGINIARTGSERDGYENRTFGGQAFANVAAGFSVRASARHTRSRSEFDSGFPLPLDSDDVTEAEQTYLRGEANWELDGVAFTFATAYTDARTENFAFGGFSDSIYGTKRRIDLRAHVPLGGGDRLTVLAETERETFQQRLVFFPAADQDQAAEQHGFAAEYFAAIGDALFVSLGTRFDINGQFRNAWTWRATASYAPAAWDVRFHASAGTGVKNPDFYELYGFVPTSFVGNPDLSPEDSLGFDAGAEIAFARGAALIDITWFYADLNDEIFTDFTVFPFTARNRDGSSTRQGVEISGTADLGGGFALSGAYTYTRATERGAPELRRPEHIASLNLDYSCGGGRFSANLGVDYHGRQRDTDFATFSTVTLNAYTLVRLAAAYEIADGLALTARAENLFDENYEEVVGYRTRGFGAFAGLRAEFGG